MNKRVQTFDWYPIRWQVLGIKPTILALQAPCSNNWATEDHIQIENCSVNLTPKFFDVLDFDRGNVLFLTHIHILYIPLAHPVAPAVPRVQNYRAHIWLPCPSQCPECPCWTLHTWTRAGWCAASVLSASRREERKGEKRGGIRFYFRKLNNSNRNSLILQALIGYTTSTSQC